MFHHRDGSIAKSLRTSQSCTLYSARYWSRSFFFNDTATTEIYTLSLHDALPIFCMLSAAHPPDDLRVVRKEGAALAAAGWREIGRAHVLNSSHANISYAVFCLKKTQTPSTPTYPPHISGSVLSSLRL